MRKKKKHISLMDYGKVMGFLEAMEVSEYHYHPRTTEGIKHLAVVVLSGYDLTLEEFQNDEYTVV